MTTPRIGTSGWSYPSGAGSWNGIFYPWAAGRGRTGSARDELAYYAERFDTVEVNSTFYRVPSSGTARSWVRRTPSGFTFSIKLYQKFTHPRMFAEATGSDAPVEQPDIDAFRAALDPIASAGKLGAILAQFPPSFRADPESRDHLATLLRTFDDYPVAVELRHRTWSDDQAATRGVLDPFGAAWVQIDEPKFRFSIEQDRQPNVERLYYMRLHGRNAERWWRHDHPEQRYDYLYSRDEIGPFADSIRGAGRRVAQAYVYLNNHFAAQAVVNAVQLKRSLDVPIRGTYPDAFVSRYPEVADVVATATPRLPLRTCS